MYSKRKVVKLSLKVARSKWLHKIITVTSVMKLQIVWFPIQTIVSIAPRELLLKQNVDLVDIWINPSHTYACVIWNKIREIDSWLSLILHVTLTKSVFLCTCFSSSLKWKNRITGFHIFLIALLLHLSKTYSLVIQPGI